MAAETYAQKEKRERIAELQRLYKPGHKFELLYVGSYLKKRFTAEVVAVTKAGNIKLIQTNPPKGLKPRTWTLKYSKFGNQFTTTGSERSALTAKPVK